MVITILTGFCCVFLAFQDFKNREVSLIVLILLFLGCLVITFNEIGLEVFLLAGINSILIVLLFLGLFMYYSIKKRKLTNILDSEIGKGDLVILFAITPLFIPINLLVFVIFSVLVSIIISIPLKLKEIPLAGFIVCSLLLYFALSKLDIINGLIPFLNFSWT